MSWGFENASQRKTYVGVVFDKGEKLVKKNILESLPEEWSDLHNNGYIHIHDLDAYGLTYNCLTFNILNKFPYSSFDGMSDSRKILNVFEYYKSTISKIGNEQSGGMAFANFDNETATIFKNLNIHQNDLNNQLIADQINSFITWINDSHERMGEVAYYVTLNLGLAENDFAKFICYTVLDEFEKSSVRTIKPNIVFKVKIGINYNQQDENRYLFDKAINCTIKKMIPTYMLCDCESNKNFDPHELAIMGCRTKVVADLYGKNTTIGRGNIDNITINLPRLAFESKDMTEFKNKWLEVADKVKDILLDRYKKVSQMSVTDFPTNLSRDLWLVDFSKADNIEEIFKHGTLAIGFIGLSEAIEILTGKKYYLDNLNYDLAVNFVKFMRHYVDSLRDTYQLNFSLLATSGEYISGRFPEIDSKIYSHKVLEKEYYTNSFHIDVDSNLPAIEKIQKEGIFHNYCNGGCITYVELKSAPIGNSEAIEELIDTAIKSGVHYFGINYPLDICNDCGEKGVFDKCVNCGSNNITRIRRVSGYLEILDYFVSGKKAEVRNRRCN